MPSASKLLARTMKARGIETVFHITGAPNIQLTAGMREAGHRAGGCSPRDAAAGMAFAHARVTGHPAVCLAPAGPGAVNMIPTAVHAAAEECPLIMLGGASPLSTRGTGSFQELDQVVLFAPAVKQTLQLTRPGERAACLTRRWPWRPRRARAQVYLDLPGDVLGGMSEEDVPVGPAVSAQAATPPTAAQVDAILDAFAAAQRPLIVSGSGIIWAAASAAMEDFVNLTGVPFFTTPQGRGVISEDHGLALLGARTLAFREADFVLSLGTRSNFIIGHLKPPRWAEGVTVAMVNLDGDELAKTAPTIAVRRDAGLVLEALNERLQQRPADKARLAPWIERLRQKDAAASAKMLAMASNDAQPIHPLRLMAEIAKVLDKDSIVIEDGHDTLGFCRHSLKSHRPGHRINRAPWAMSGWACPSASVPRQPGLAVRSLSSPVTVPSAGTASRSIPPAATSCRSSA